MNIFKMAMELVSGVFIGLAIITVAGAILLLIFAVLFIIVMGLIAAIFV